ncbi:unnamed protein product [Rotaria sp. Silwood2]|nr:unnamed protein product [Rotaria sp. Silwood2]
MPNHVEMASHCLVRWEDDINQFAVVDTKRSKSVSTLKIGLTTCFEGYQRERRRGTVLFLEHYITCTHILIKCFIYFLGSKRDCCAYGLDVAGDDGHVNTYQWSVPPGLREESEEIAQTIRQSTSSFKRTISTMSSSSTSSTTAETKQKRKKINSNNINDDEQTTKYKSKPPSSLASTITICDAFKTSDKCASQGEQSNSNSKHQSSSHITATCSTTNSVTSSSTDINSLIEEIKVLREKLSSMDSLVAENTKLREKVLSMQDDMFYLRNTLISLPDEESYNYLKSIVDTYEQRKAELNEKSVELGNKLPCSKIELKQAKSTNSSRTINSLITCCYKGVDLKGQCYTKLKKMNPELMNNIYKYVQYVHAPKIISPTEFSGAISLRSRHLVDRNKNKENSSTASTKKQHQKYSKSKTNTEHQRGPLPPKQILMENFDCE